MHFTGYLLLLVFLSYSAFGQDNGLNDGVVHHLRNGDRPEWTEFEGLTTTKDLTLRFKVDTLVAHTLSMVQYDVKQPWDVLVNERKIGGLIVDGNRMKVYFKLPPNIIKQGINELRIQAASRVVDDVTVSDISLERQDADSILSKSTIDVFVMDSKRSRYIPSRITITDQQGTLQSIGTKAASNLAIRPGTVYTSDGRASLSVPPGRYRIYATSGFEYSVDSVTLEIRPGEKQCTQLLLEQEVNTDGWINSDTHIHTLTHSGHGDASNSERALTIAGEGIDLPIITEHNKVRDFSEISAKAKVKSFYTVVHGNEVTTAVGHFNIFPVNPDSVVPDHTVKDWATLVRQLPAKTHSIVILNHGRDIHNGFRPFDSTKHISIAGYRVDHWPIPANAMEVVNSGALLSDPLSLFHDWFGLMNHGVMLTPIGSSDSHDVGRYLVGQARTYIRSNSRDRAHIDVSEAVSNIRAGKVMVSFGLLTKMTVNKKAGSGDLALSSENNFADVEVAGPSWIKAEKVSIYANGIKIFEETITNKNLPGIKSMKHIKLPSFKQDVFLVAIAEGSGPHQPFWPIVKPFQPVSPSWRPYTLGASGAIFIDVDKDGKFNDANSYARKLLSMHKEDFEKLFRSLSAFDGAVAVQAAAVLHENGVDLHAKSFQQGLSTAAPYIQRAFQKFMEALAKTTR